MTIFISNIDLFYNYNTIKPRWHEGSRRVTLKPTSSLLMPPISKYKNLPTASPLMPPISKYKNLPTASPLMTYISKYNMLQQKRSWYSKHFLTSPMLRAYPSELYAGSAQYLALCAVSISRQLLIIRKPLRILGTIVANKYADGIFMKLLELKVYYRMERDKKREHYRLLQDLKGIILVSILIGLSVYCLLVPGAVLEKPGFFTSSDIVELLRIAKNTYIRYVCSEHNVPSPCPCNEALNHAMPIFLDSKELPFDPLKITMDVKSRAAGVAVFVGAVILGLALSDSASHLEISAF